MCSSLESKKAKQMEKAKKEQEEKDDLYKKMLGQISGKYDQQDKYGQQDYIDYTNGIRGKWTLSDNNIK